MKKYCLTLCVAVLFACTHTPGPDPDPGPGPGPGPDPVEDDVKVMTISELNVDDEPLDSHKGEEMSSVLEPMAEFSILVPSSQLCVSPIYPRLKKMQNGEYFLMYQSNQIASTIYYSTGSDLSTWSRAQKVFTPSVIDTPGGEDTRRYSSADAVVLQNGDILAVAASRANSGYSKYPECNYVAMRRSTDNGATWGEEQAIYTGTTWEPYLLQLPSGKIQCYFTDTDPVKLNSGTSIVESTDNGKTWSPTGVSNCYKVIRQYKYDYDGTPIYTDQMPCVRMLNDGHTLLGFMEARLEKPENQPATSTSKSYYQMSVVRGQDEFPHLQAGQTGPADRESNVLTGAAGYVSQFPSGETVLSCNISNIFKLKIGDCTGKKFQGVTWTDKWLQALPEKGFWGSTEVIASHEIVGTMHCSSGIQIQKFYLNHRIDAPVLSVTVDGDNADWTHTQAWFIGSSDASVQTCIRGAHDASSLYFLVDRLDKYVHPGDNITFYITGGESLGAESLGITLSPDGSASALRYVDGIWEDVTLPEGFSSAVKVVGKMGDSLPDRGYVGEIAIPLTALPASVNGYFRVMVLVYNGDARDTFTWCANNNPASWMLLRIK